MRIAHVTDCFLPRLGGIERQVDHLATRQAAAGHDVSVVTAVSGMGMGGARAVDDMPLPYAVHRPPARWRSEWTSTRAAALGRTALREGGFDAVHAHISVWSPMAAACVEAAQREGLPTAVTVHSVWGPHARRLFRAADAMTAWRRWPIAWSAVSSVAAEPLRTMLPAGTAVATLPNGIDPSWWTGFSDSAPDGVVASDGSPARTVRIVAVMRFAARKRGEALIDMLAAVRSRVPASIRVEAVLVGDGPRWAKVAASIRERGMDWVQLPGRASAEQVREHYRAADIFVAPSVLESFGIAALEARCVGLPVVAFAQSGVRDIVTHDQEGLLVTSDAGMVDALTRLCVDDALRGRISEHNQATTPPFDWASSLQRCDALYARAAMLAAGGPHDASWTAELVGVPAGAVPR